MAVDGAVAAVAQAAAPGAADAAVPVAHDPMLGSSLDARLRRAALAAGENHKFALITLQAMSMT